VSTDSSHIVLFDMDGTLTAARKKASWSIVEPLLRLSNYAHIGIVTGSPMEYLKQQCSILWSDIGSIDVDNMTLFPCNGTQSYSYSHSEKEWAITSDTNMKNHMGANNYRQTIREIFALQTSYADSHTDMPLTGNFISDRKSMVNWCPIGRDADALDREKFVQFDKKNRCRESLKEELEYSLAETNVHNIVCTLGGNTSIDIYPAGWDKTYVLRHLTSYTNTWFVGDKCDGHGNDRTLYDELAPKGTSFKTLSPDNTIEIINKIVDKIKESHEAN